MFHNCHKMERIDPEFLSQIELNSNTINNYDNIFAYCSSLTEIPETFNFLPRLTSAKGTFQNCYSLSSMGSHLTIPSTVTTVENLFYNCHALKSISPTFKFSADINKLSRMFL